jgi:hypothetical protein
MAVSSQDTARKGEETGDREGRISRKDAKEAKIAKKTFAGLAIFAGFARKKEKTMIKKITLILGLAALAGPLWRRSQATGDRRQETGVRRQEAEVRSPPADWGRRTTARGRTSSRPIAARPDPRPDGRGWALHPRHARGIAERRYSIPRIRESHSAKNKRRPADWEDSRR